MNESVREMIKKLHARLDDLEAVVKDVPFELNGYDKKLDKIDDQVYLIELGIEKKLKSAIPIAPVSDAQSDAFDKAAHNADVCHASSPVDNDADDRRDSQAGRTQDTVHIVGESEEGAPSKVTIEAEQARPKPTLEEEGFLTDSAKETIAGATKKLNSFYKEGKEVVGEFSEAFGDIKEVFGKNPFKKR